MLLFAWDLVKYLNRRIVKGNFEKLNCNQTVDANYLLQNGSPNWGACNPGSALDDLLGYEKKLTELLLRLHIHSLVSDTL